MHDPLSAPEINMSEIIIHGSSIYKQEDRPAPPTHSDILYYWVAYEGDLHNLIGWESVDHLKDCYNGEYACWACGMRRESYKKLERCHIHPYALGGSNDVSNFFLMCKSCHRESPDTAYPSIFFDWVKTKNNDLDQFMMDCHKAVGDVADKLGNDLSLVSVVLERFKSSPINSHGGLSRSTTTGILRHILEQMVREKEQGLL